MPPPNILTPLQSAFLNEFFKQSAGQEFFFTGGTALAAFYLYHRYSDDLDLFTLSELAFREMSRLLPAIVLNLNSVFEERIRTANWQQGFVRVRNGETLKIDLVRDVGAQFGTPQRLGDVIVDSELNIAVNKITAVFSRADTKDFVDLYFLLKKGYSLNELIRLARKRFGLERILLGGNVARKSTSNYLAANDSATCTPRASTVL